MKKIAVLFSVLALCMTMFTACRQTPASPDSSLPQDMSTTTTTTTTEEAATTTSTEEAATTTSMEETPTTTTAATTAKPTATTTAEKPTTVVSTTMTTSTTTATTTTVTVPAEPPAQMELPWDGETIRLDFQNASEYSPNIGTNLAGDIVAIPEEEKDDGSWKYTAELADGRTIRCDVLPKSGEICRLGVFYTAHNAVGENDPQVVLGAAKSLLNHLGCDHREEDIEVSMQGDMAPELGYFAYVILNNEEDGCAFMHVRKQKGHGWQVVEMYLDVGHPLRKVKWVTE